MINIAYLLKVVNGNSKAEISRTFSRVFQDCLFYSGTQLLTTTPGNLNLQSPDVAAGGVTQTNLVLICNLDTTETVQVGKDVAGVFRTIVKIPPGEFSAFSVLEGVVLQAKAIENTALVEHTSVQT